jgi:hypothetical protein
MVFSLVASAQTAAASRWGWLVLVDRWDYCADDPEQWDEDPDDEHDPVALAQGSDADWFEWTVSNADFSGALLPDYPVPVIGSPAVLPSGWSYDGYAIVHNF